MDMSLSQQIERDYDELLRQTDTPESPGAAIMQHLTQRYIEEHCLSSGKPFPTFLKPVFLTPPQMQDVRRVTNIIMDALEKVSNLFFESDEYLPLFELAPGEVDLARIRPGYPRKVQHARLDAFMEGDRLQFCEFNCDTPGGPGYSDIQVDLLMETPVMQRFTKKYNVLRDHFMQNVLDSLLDCYAHWGGNTSAKPRILIHTIYKMDPTMEELLALQKFFINQGYETVVAQPQECAFDQGKLFVAGAPVELVYRRGATQWWLSNPAEYSEILKAYRAGAICMANALNSKLAGKKSLMAVLQSEQMADKLTEEEKDIVAKHIPWTRIVRPGATTYDGQTVDLLPFLRENRANMVLKPIGLFGGKNVVVGPDADDQAWEEALKLAAQETYVAQEYIPIPTVLLPVYEPQLHFVAKKVNMNFFAFNGQYAGGMARVSDSSIINISAGGGLIPILVAEPRS